MSENETSPEDAIKEAIGAAEEQHPDVVSRVMAAAPETINRPLCLVQGRAYAAAWVWVETEIHRKQDKEGKVTTFRPPKIETVKTLAIVRDDGTVFSDGRIKVAKPIRDLGITVKLPEPVAESRAWSGAGMLQYQAGERPNPADVFARITDTVDTFMDFSRSLGGQEEMSRLIATYILATYFLDAFNVVGYLWPNGDRGSGKTILLNTVCELAFLGQVVLAGGSYASLRDLADYGACLAFDDAEAIMDTRKTDPDKRALMLAGNRRGATVPLKEPAGKRGWVTRYVNAFSPRLFSAIRLPDDVLGSRTIIVPLVRSGDCTRINLDPVDHEVWPHERRALVDDLWATALANLSWLRSYDTEAAKRARLSGRNLEPWRWLFAVALWLQQEHGVDGLFDELEGLSAKYQEEKSDLEAFDLTRLALMALKQMFAEAGQQKLEFTTADLTAKVNDVARETEIAKGDEDFTNSRRVGWRLKRLRLSKNPSRLGRVKRGWVVTDAELAGLLNSYGMAVEPASAGSPQNGEDGATYSADVGVEPTETAPPAFTGHATEPATKMAEGEV